MTEEYNPKPPSRVSRVGIGRLYNLGNYEHIRYDITIEIPEGGDVLDSVSKLRQIVRALKPRKSSTSDALRRARMLVEKTSEERTLLIEKRGYSAENFEEAQELLERAAVRDQKRKAALDLFNDLGGATVYTDHKEQWDDDYDEY